MISLKNSWPSFGSFRCMPAIITTILPSGDQSVPYGIPYTVASPSHTLVTPTFTYTSESDPGPYPFGPDTPIEGGAQSTGDRHANMVTPATCTLSELDGVPY